VIEKPLDESLLGRTFDQYQNFMHIALCLKEVARQTSIAKPKVLELHRRTSGLAEYIPDADLVRYATHTDDQPSLPSPLQLPFPDKAFDACLISDVYEHLPQAQRPELLREMIRVTRGMVMVGSPVANEVVNRCDRIVFDFIWGKYGEKFEPLRQHVTYGLESLEDIVASLRSQGADRVIPLPCNYVYRWLHQILIYFDLQHLQPHWDLYEPLNRIYNQRLSPYDYREPCYRYLIVVAVDPRLDVDVFSRQLKGPREVPAAVAETEGLLLQEFLAIESRAGDVLRQQGEEITRLNESLTQARQEIEKLAHVIRQTERGLWFRLRTRLSRLFKASNALSAT
jgi:hypothetical protein